MNDVIKMYAMNDGNPDLEPAEMSADHDEMEEDDEVVAAREEKKRKKEEEERRKKNESRGVKELKKVDTSGMKKLSAFFAKVPAKK